MKVGIIGCGAVAPKHAEAYGKIEKWDSFNYCDLYPNRALKLSRRYNNIAYWVYGWSNYRQFISNEKLDLVSICTPSSTHAEIAIQCAKAGVNVICEKPIDVDLGKAQKMIDAFEESDASLSVIFQNRWHLDVRQMQLESYIAWQPIKASMTVNWYRPDDYFKGWKGILKLGGDIILNQIIHHIDILRYIFGEVDSVFAYTQITRLVGVGTPDVCVAVMKFKSGMVATLDATTNCYPKNDRTELTVITDKGVKRIEPKGVSHEHQIRHVVDCIRDGKQPEVTGEDALKSLEVAVALHRSAFTGKEITL